MKRSRSQPSLPGWLRSRLPISCPLRRAGVLLVVGGVLVVYGLMIWMRRRDYRSTQSNYDPRAIDE